MTLEQIRVDILNKKILEFDSIIVENDILIVEEYGSWSEFCKNDDDCADAARENGEQLIEMYSTLEIHNYYCHRHKYAIVELKLKA